MASSILVSFDSSVCDDQIEEIFSEYGFCTVEVFEARRNWTPHYRGLRGVITRYCVEIPNGEVKKYLEIFTNLPEVRGVQVFEEYDKPKRTYKRESSENMTSSKSGKKIPRR
jgi:hypothetical protein